MLPNIGARDFVLMCLGPTVFEANGIQYLRIGLEGNTQATEFVIDINNGRRSVPTIIFPDGSVLVEPSWEELRVKTSAV